MTEQQIEQRTRDLYVALKQLHTLYLKYGREGAIKVYQLISGETVEGATKMVDMAIALY